MSRLIQVPVDDKFDTSMKKVNEELRYSGEEIINSTPVTKSDGSTVMVISVKKSTKKESRGSSKNLLLDQVPSIFNGKKILFD